MSDTKERIVVDNESGEAFLQTVIDLTPKKGKKPDASEGFVQVWPGAMIASGISNAAMRVLLVLAGRMDPKTGVVDIHLDDINSELGYAHTTKISEHISELVKADVARRRPNRRLALDPNLVWRGSGGDRNVVRWRWHGETREANT